LGELDAINPTAPRRFITLPGRNPGLEPGCDPGPRGFKRCALSLPGSRLFAALRPGSVKWPASCDVLANYFWSCANMKRAALFACLLAFTTPALAQAPSATGGPITSQAERDAIAARVRGGASCAGCDLFQISLAYQSVAGRNFAGARIRQADLSLTTADRARFHGANMSLTNFFGARLS